MGTNGFDRWWMKDGVSDGKLLPELKRLEPLACKAFAAFGSRTVVTCTTGDHAGRKSYHNLGAAFDLRLHHLAGYGLRRSVWSCLRHTIADAYPGQYDVLLEDAENQNAHIHVECAPALALAMFGSEDAAHV
jgi:hypothetical protein